MPTRRVSNAHLFISRSLNRRFIMVLCRFSFNNPSSRLFIVAYIPVYPSVERMISVLCPVAECSVLCSRGIVPA
ncbi:hypothetical protein TcasGA2_TC034743 [Tribolium castaneum]|uniref:Uncharacterized protein n=1 Tax=Tribolium castaneum TaxID=7070 RepID=A0A139WG65_TRICA|nr:hypothetical protein TcasGA2_TC034743 [Tribolium castaneum]